MAGLPNVQGECTVTGGKGFSDLTKTGPFYTGTYLTKSGYSEASSKISMYYLGFSLAETNTLYGNSETVTPESLTTFMLIKY